MRKFIDKFELEGKFRVDNLNIIRKRLSKYQILSNGSHEEENTMHDAFAILKTLGYTLRFRADGRYVVTLKGKDKGDHYSKRLELEKNLPKSLYDILKSILPTTASYSKTREEYFPIGDSTCTICLDYVHGKGTFVEIEASSENQINLWKSRLGITSHAIRTPYYKLDWRYEKNGLYRKNL